MKKILTLTLLTLSLLSKAGLDFGKFNYRGKLNFNLIKASADSFFSSANSNPISLQVEQEDNDYFRYKRWEWYWKDRVQEDGSFPDLLEQALIYNQHKSNTESKTISQVASWVNISQTSTTGGYNGMGRLTSIAFHPSIPDIFWVGAPIGGIWKTIDGGLTYSPLGDGLPYCSVGTILVDPTNPDIIYITLGDNGGWWEYGLGVYKTTDGGLTWNATSMLSNFSDGIAYYSMAMSPANPNVILLANSNGLFRTSNGGANWSLVHSGAFKDVKFRPNDSTTVYAASDDYWGSSEVYKSTNGGINFSSITSFATQFNTIKLTVTPANPNQLGVLVSGNISKNYYKSSNNGASLTLVSAVPEDAIIYISPLDSNKVYTGYMNIYQSINGGATWTQITNWYNNGVQQEVHADQHYVSYNPINDMIYFCNDGGLYNYDEVFNSWAELNNTLIITQFYSIAVSQNNPIFMIGGTQDNGGRKRTTQNSWSATNGGDALETAIDEGNDQVIYTTYVNGKLYRSLDQWTNDTYHDITPAGITGNWFTPYQLNPQNQSCILAGYEDVYKSSNRGNIWSKISTNITGNSADKLEQLQMAPSDSNYIYASRVNKFYSTSNYGSTWITHTLPFANSNFSKITSITVSAQNPLLVYVTVGGYSFGKKVYMSISGGATWTNISGGLPNVPVSAGVIDESSSNHEFYIGTDIGVYYRNDTNATWIYWGTNLPNTAVTDLKIQQATHKLRAATFGRGVWECDLLSVATSAENTSKKETLNVFTMAFNPVNNTLLLNAFVHSDLNSKIQIYDGSGRVVFESSNHFQLGNYQIALDVSYLPEGIFYLKVGDATATNSLKFLHSCENETH